SPLSRALLGCALDIVGSARQFRADRLLGSIGLLDGVTHCDVRHVAFEKLHVGIGENAWRLQRHRKLPWLDRQALPIVECKRPREVGDVPNGDDVLTTYPSIALKRGLL